LTDALVTLGHLYPKVLLDGELPISRAKAQEAVTYLDGFQSTIAQRSAA